MIRKIKLIKNNQRIDKALAMEVNDLSRSQINKLFKENKILLDGHVVKPSFKVDNDIYVEILLIDSKKEDVPLAENIELDIIYEDDDIIVVNKPRGMVVHPGAGNNKGTLVNALLSHTNGVISNNNGIDRSGIVHRLDKETSGVIVCAKNNFAHENLQKQFQQRQVIKNYVALVNGDISEQYAKIETMIARNPQNRQRMSVEKIGKKAITYFRVVENLEDATFIQLNLITGRTHQIRVHMNYINHPIIGDDLYGNKNSKVKSKSMCLHARSIEFRHPTNNKNIRFIAPLDEDFIKILKDLNYDFNNDKLFDNPWNLEQIDIYAN